MLPVITIIGRPNVGKSTLFNRLTKTRAALVADVPGVTRDRLYGQAHYDDHDFIVIDTGGIMEKKEGLEGLMEQQVWQAVDEADILLFVVEARSGLSPLDEIIAKRLRILQKQKPIIVIVNKAEGLDSDIALSEFYRLGFPKLNAVSSAHGIGISTLMQTIISLLPAQSQQEEFIGGVKVAVVGRPNVGKSTLINRMLGEERVLVYDMPGTTRDSIFIPFERHGKEYTLIDTAGVRRRRSLKEAVEKFSVIKTLQAIEESEVVVFVCDAKEGLVDQDLKLIGFILEAGKALVLAVNKWDNLTLEDKETVKSQLDRRLGFIDFVEIHFISALHGTGVGNLFASINKAYKSADCDLSTSELTRILQMAVEAHHPPSPQGRLIKLRYAHAGGHHPPVIVIHGKQTESLPHSYIRYLENYFRDTLKLVGTPIRIELKSDDNPYSTKRA